MFGAPDNNGTGRYGIRANGDTQFVYGSFGNRKTALWYGDSEFGRFNYSIVIL